MSATSEPMAHTHKHEHTQTHTYINISMNTYTHHTHKFTCHTHNYLYTSSTKMHIHTSHAHILNHFRLCSNYIKSLHIKVDDNLLLDKNIVLLVIIMVPMHIVPGHKTGDKWN